MSELSIGRYAVIDRVGAGGMAEVFRCRQRGLGGFDKTVIIKRILPNLLEDPEFINMFLDEARLAANLNHPNIVQVFEIDQVDGVPFIVMEYVNGPTLGQVLRAASSLGKLHFGHVVKLISGVCEGLHYAHHAVDSSGQPLGVVHRDISPHNVIISLDGTPKVLDFGVAKARGRLAASQVGTLKGKLRYMAPEQISSAEGAVDLRADVYSLGVCLYLGTVGRLPFRGDNDAAVLNAVLNEPLQPPSSLVPNYPPELEKLVLWAMARKPAERCPDAATLYQALEEVVASGPLASNKRQVAAWMGELMPEIHKVALAGQASATPVGSRSLPPRIEGTPVSKRMLRPPAEPLEVEIDVGTGVAPPARRGRALLVGGALLAVLALAVGGWASLRPAPAPAPAPSPAPLAVVAPPVPAGRSEADKNAAAAAYVAEAERLLAQHRYKAALDILEKGRALDASDASANIALARLQDQAELEAALTRAREAKARGESEEAKQAAREVLDRDPQNEEARALLEALKPARAPTSGKPAQSGALWVTATPEATVYLDDERVGTTPLRLPRVTAGKHALQLRAKGFAPAEREVKVLAGQEAKLALTLEKATPTPVPEAKVEPPKIATGTLIVTSKPEASVSVDGAPVGRTPWRGAAVPVGSRLIELREPGHAPQSRRVELREGAEETATFELVPEVKPAPVAAVVPPAPVAPVVKKPRLPVSYTAHSVKDLARVLSVVESEASATGAQAPEKVARSTAALLDELTAAFAPGQSIELFPRGMYYLIVSQASKGVAPANIAQQLKSAHLRNELADYQP